MKALTLVKRAPAPALPELDRPDADQIGDEILLEAAGKVRNGRVSGGTSSSRQSADARAWTLGGRVD
jgi:hypothetical protein